jgi:hypothetical protein
MNAEVFNELLIKVQARKKARNDETCYPAHLLSSRPQSEQDILQHPRRSNDYVVRQGSSAWDVSLDSSISVFRILLIEQRRLDHQKARDATHQLEDQHRARRGGQVSQLLMTRS